MASPWDDWVSEGLLTDYLHVEQAAIDLRVTDDLTAEHVNVAVWQYTAIYVPLCF